MMRRNLVILAIMAMIVLGIGCGGARESFSLAEEPGMEMRIYEVFGMDCPGCHGGVEKLVNKLPGVIASQANWEEQTLAIKVRKDSDLTDDEIHDAIKRANFTPGKRIK